jgi:hypothetical protein
MIMEKDHSPMLRVENSSFANGIAQLKRKKIKELLLGAQNKSNVLTSNFAEKEDLQHQTRTIKM